MKIDFRVSPDTIVWIIIFILILGNIISFRAGYKQGEMDEKIGWLEDQQLKEIENE